MKEAAIEAKHVGCLNCGGNEELAPLDMIIAVGFGMANCTKDGVEVYSEPTDLDSAQEEDFKTVGEMEALAVLDPDHDWQILKDAPLNMGRWQRQGVGRWVLVEEGPGFA